MDSAKIGKIKEKFTEKLKGRTKSINKLKKAQGSNQKKMYVNTQ